MKLFSSIFGCIFVALAMNAGVANASCSGNWQQGFYCRDLGRQENLCGSHIECEWVHHPEYDACDGGTYFEWQSCSKFDFDEAGCNDETYCTWSSPTPPSAQNDSIYLKNDCNQHGPIYVAINYQDLGDVWKTDGFWVLEYGQTAGPFPTKIRQFYVHAHAKNDDFIWEGNWGPWQLYGRDYKFSEATITTTSWGDWIQRFTCE